MTSHSKDPHVILEAAPTEANAAEKFKHWKRLVTGKIDRLPDTTTESEKLDVIISHVSALNYILIENETLSATALQILENAFIKPPNLLVSRFKLSKRVQLPSESLNDFARELTKLMPDCKYKAVTTEQRVDQTLRDVFIWGIASPLVRSRLLEHKATSFSETLKLAVTITAAHSDAQLGTVSMEVAKSEAGETAKLQEGAIGSSCSSKVNAVAFQKKKCDRCGFFFGGSCPAIGSSCNFCHGIGHWAKACRKKSRKNFSHSDTTPHVKNNCVQVSDNNGDYYQTSEEGRNRVARRNLRKVAKMFLKSRQLC